jgi:putative ABC transport system substrate-binding protein
MTAGMQRRHFITLIGGAAIWPLAVRAQGMPVVGFLNGQSAAAFVHLLAAFREGLKQTGFVEGENVRIEYRWAEGQTERLPALADDLVRGQVAVVVATGGAAMAAKAATSVIPTVITLSGDPVKLGFAASLNRPGGNVTGMTVFSSVLEAKRLELLHELVPAADPIGVLVNREFTTDVEGQQLREITAAARAIGKSIKAVNANSESELEAAFVALAEARVGAVSVTGGTFNLNKRVQIVALAARYALPAIYENRESVTAGGLMSYGTNVPDVYRQVGIYVGRILKGDKPAELPFVQPAKFDMAVNLKTARALSITVPSALLLRADEVIE